MGKRTGSVWIGASALLGLLFSVGDVHAQGMPDRKEIERRVREAFPQVVANSPEVTVQVEGVAKITYRQIPTDPRKIADALGKELGQDAALPPGVDINQYIGMFQSELSELLNECLQDVGSFEALRPLKLRSRTIPVGVHRIGLVFDGERPVAIRIFDKEKVAEDDEDESKLKRPVDIQLRTRSVDLQEALQIELREPRRQRRGEEKFEIYLTFLRFLARSSASLEATD